MNHYIWTVEESAHTSLMALFIACARQFVSCCLSLSGMIVRAWLFLQVHQHTVYVLMSMGEELCVSVCKWSPLESRSVRRRACACVRAWVCMDGAQEACSCMTQVPHGTLALALLTASPQAALVKRPSQIINIYTLIICWNSTSISVDLTNIMQTGKSVSAAESLFFNMLQDFWTL